MSGPTFRQRITLAQFLAAHFAAQRKGPLNAEALEEMTVGERLAAAFGGRVAAWVSLPKPATRATVVNEPRFRAWVKKHLPEGIETVEQVRPETEKAFLEQAKASDGKWLNTETGEYVVIEGIKVETGDPSPRVELTPDAAEVIGEAWRAGAIEPLSVEFGPLALPAPVPREREAETARPAREPEFADFYGFLDPERAAAYTALLGGYSTPPAEAYRMMRDGPVGDGRARAWLAAHDLDPDDPDEGGNVPWPLPAAGGDGDAD